MPEQFVLPTHISFSLLLGKLIATLLKAVTPLLIWIGLDHVVNLTETHLHTMYLRVNQVHVQASDVLQNPLSFLDLLSRHRVTFSFAPNFFIAKPRQVIATTMDHPNAELFRSQLDLTCLQTLTSGGEANVVETCSALSNLLTDFGVGNNVAVISPGLGTTETCPGSIYNKDCPGGHLEAQREIAALGTVF